MNTNGHRARGIAPTENSSCPRFIAYTHEDSFVEADDNLETLIAEVLSDDVGEDVVIWEDTTTIAAVITANKVTRFRRRKV